MHDLTAAAAVHDDRKTVAEVNADISDFSDSSVRRRLGILAENEYLTEEHTAFLERDTAAQLCYSITDRGIEALTAFNVCTACEAVRPSSDHYHEFVPAADVLSRDERMLVSREHIDVKDLRILRTVASESLWKQKIAERTGMSPQTAGRRVNRLQDRGFLEAQLIQADEVQNEFIVAFQATEKAVQLLEEEREAWETYEACNECETVIGPEAHRHTWVAASEFFEVGKTVES